MAETKASENSFVNFEGFEWDLGSDLHEEASPFQPKQPRGLTLEELFPENVWNQTQTSTLEPTKEVIDESHSPSLFKKVVPYWLDPTFKNQPPPLVTNTFATSKTEAISSTPTLEAPEGVFIHPQDVIRIPQPPINNDGGGGEISSAEHLKALSQMSGRTMEQIMTAIIKAQVELERDAAEVTEQTFEKTQIYMKVHQKLLNEIYDALQHDEKVGEYIKGAQKVAFYASIIAGIAFVVVSQGLLAVPAGIVGSLAGAGVEALFTTVVTLVATYGPIAGGVLMALTSASQMYNKMKFKEDNARHHEAKTIEQNYDRRTEELRENAVALAEADQAFKDRLIDLTKRLRRMRQFLIQNNK